MTVVTGSPTTLPVFHAATTPAHLEMAVAATPATTTHGTAAVPALAGDAAKAEAAAHAAVTVHVPPPTRGPLVLASVGWGAPHEEKKAAPAANKANVVAIPIDTDFQLPPPSAELTTCQKVGHVAQNVGLGVSSVFMMGVGVWSAATGESNWLTGFAFGTGAFTCLYTMYNNACGESIRLRAMLEKAQKWEAAALGQMNRLVGRVTAITQKIGQENDRLKEATGVLATQAAEANAATAALGDTVEKAKGVEAGLDRVEASLAGVVADDKGVNDKLHGMLGDLSKQLGGYKDTLKQLGAEVPELVGLTEEMTKSEEGFGAACQKILGTFGALVKQLEGLSKLKRQVAELEASLNAVQAELTDQSKENARLHSEVTRFMAEIDQLDRDKQELRKLEGSLHVEIESLKKASKDEGARTQALIQAMQSASAAVAPKPLTDDATATLEDADQLLAQLGAEHA